MGAPFLPGPQLMSWGSRLRNTTDMLPGRPHSELSTVRECYGMRIFPSLCTETLCQREPPYSALPAQ